jgi:hypothetical protein
MIMPFMRGAPLAFGLLLLVSCVAMRDNREGSEVGPAQFRAFHRAPPPAPWPSYAVVDYQRAGHPKLSADELSQLRAALERVRPCQRALLRYAFPSKTWSTASSFVIYFDDPGYSTGAYGQGRWVFGTDAIYEPSRGLASPIIVPHGGHQNIADLQVRDLIARGACPKK